MDFDLVAFAQEYGILTLDIIVVTVLVVVLWVRTASMRKDMHSRHEVLREHLDACGEAADRAHETRKEIYDKIGGLDRRLSHIEGLLEMVLKGKDA